MRSEGRGRPAHRSPAFARRHIRNCRGGRPAACRSISAAHPDVSRRTGGARRGRISRARAPAPPRPHTARRSETCARGGLYQRSSRPFSLPPSVTGCNSVDTVDEKNWRTTYTQLLKQLQEMRRQLARAQDETRELRERTVREREKLKAVRTERRSVARFTKGGEPEDFIRRRKKR